MATVVTAASPTGKQVIFGAALSATELCVVRQAGAGARAGIWRMPLSPLNGDGAGWPALTAALNELSRTLGVAGGRLNVALMPPLTEIRPSRSSANGRARTAHAALAKCGALFRRRALGAAGRYHDGAAAAERSGRWRDGGRRAAAPRGLAAHGRARSRVDRRCRLAGGGGMVLSGIRALARNRAPHIAPARVRRGSHRIASTGTGTLSGRPPLPRWRGRCATRGGGDSIRWRPRAEISVACAGVGGRGERSAQGTCARCSHRPVLPSHRRRPNGATAPTMRYFSLRSSPGRTQRRCSEVTRRSRRRGNRSAVPSRAWPRRRSSSCCCRDCSRSGVRNTNCVPSSRTRGDSVRRFP